MALAIGSTLGSYEITALIGAGGTRARLGPSGRQLYYVVEQSSGAVATQIDVADIDERTNGLTVGRVLIVGTNTGSLRERDAGSPTVRTWSP